MPDLLKPELYTVPADGLPALRGGRCTCGHVFFPMQTYGCEACGATGDALMPTLLAGKGRLVASARVMLHARKDREPPFTVVTVRLDDGPVLRTLLDGNPDAPLPVGQPLRATLAEVTGPNGPALDLRFTPQS
jgi:uncharacterized OB-fold protein